MTEQVTPYDFSPSPSVGLGECGHAPSHPEEADTLLGIRQDSADNIAAYLADLRNDVINGAMATMKVRGELNFVYGWLGQMAQLDNDAAWRPLITAIMGHIDRALSEGAATS